MIVEPKVREFICTTAHPQGCRENVREQIAYVKKQNITGGPKKVLVIGASTGIWTGKQDHSRFRMSCSYTWNHV